MRLAEIFRCFKPEIDRPIADALHLCVLAPAPNQHAVPPRRFRSLTGRSRIERFDRIGRLNLRLQIFGRRERPQGFDPVAAG